MSECAGPNCTHPDCTHRDRAGRLTRAEEMRLRTGISAEKWAIMPRAERRAAFQAARRMQR